MDMVISYSDCNLNADDPAVDRFTENNIGRDPLESGRLEDDTGIMLLHVAGPAPGLMRVVMTDPTALQPGSRSSIGFGFIEHDPKIGTSWGRSTARGAMAVGAAHYQETPAFGVSPPRIASYSSIGGTPLLFDTRGNRLSTPKV
jgi:hypothetical protein